MDESQKTMLALNSVKKSYKSKEVLKGISFSICAGDIYGFIGPNGVGKTTTIKAITGLAGISSGTITMNHEMRIGVVLDQNCLYSNFTAKENLEFYLRLFGTYQEETINYYLSEVGLADVKNVAINKFSKGMKRRIVLARTLAMKPDMLILDEPLDGLDVSSQGIIIKLLKEWVSQGERGILYTSHDMAEVESLCNKIGFIKDGRIELQGTMDEILKREFSCLRIVPKDNEDELIACMKPFYRSCEKKKEALWFEMDEAAAERMIDELYNKNIRVKEFNKIYHSLTEIYERINTYEKNN